MSTEKEQEKNEMQGGGSQIAEDDLYQESESEPEQDKDSDYKDEKEEESEDDVEDEPTTEELEDDVEDEPTEPIGELEDDDDDENNEEETPSVDANTKKRKIEDIETMEKMRLHECKGCKTPIDHKQKYCGVKECLKTNQ